MASLPLLLLPLLRGSAPLSAIDAEINDAMLLLDQLQNPHPTKPNSAPQLRTVRQAAADSIPPNSGGARSSSLLIETTGLLARCLDRHDMVVPIQHPIVAQRLRREWIAARKKRTARSLSPWDSPPFVSPTGNRYWICARWQRPASGASGRVSSTDPFADASVASTHRRADSCLTRFGTKHGTVVKATPCGAPLYESQSWTVIESKVTGLIQLHATGVAGACIVPRPACARWGQAALVGSCADAGSWWRADQRTVVDENLAMHLGLATPPDCVAESRGPASTRLEAVRRAKRNGGADSKLWERTHSEYYRDFRDAFAPVPSTYLEWLVQQFTAAKGSAPHGGLPREWHDVADAVRTQFTVATTSQNWEHAPHGRRPTKMISLALFVPTGVSSDPTSPRAERLFGHRIGYDAVCDRIEKHAPRTLEEAKFKTQGAFENKGFYGKYGQPLVSGVRWIRDSMPGWGAIVHLSPKLIWLRPILLATGNCEVRMMAAPSVRTAGALWRWLPFDDTTLDAVISFDADNMAGGKPLQQPFWSAITAWLDAPPGHSKSILRWVHGAGADNAAIPCDEDVGNPESQRIHTKVTCFNYATILANFVGAKPRELTRSFRATMEGFSLHRALLAGEVMSQFSGLNGAVPWEQYTAELEDSRLWPRAYEPEPVPKIGSHMIGWGRNLFDYGFDEALMKYAVYFEAAIQGSLFTALPPGVPQPLVEYIPSGFDALERRCSNTAFLDLLFTVLPANVKTRASSKHANTIVTLYNKPKSGGAKGRKPKASNVHFAKCGLLPPPPRVSAGGALQDATWKVTAGVATTRWLAPPTGLSDGCIEARTSKMALGLAVCLNAPGGDNYLSVEATKCWGVCAPSEQENKRRRLADASSGGDDSSGGNVRFWEVDANLYRARARDAAVARRESGRRLESVVGAEHEERVVRAALDARETLAHRNASDDASAAAHAAIAEATALLRSLNATIGHTSDELRRRLKTAALWGATCLDDHYANELKPRQCSEQQWHYDEDSKTIINLPQGRNRVCLSAMVFENQARVFRSTNFGEERTNTKPSFDVPKLRFARDGLELASSLLRLAPCLDQFDKRAWTQRWYTNPIANALMLTPPRSRRKHLGDEDSGSFCVYAEISSFGASVDATGMADIDCLDEQRESRNGELP